MRQGDEQQGAAADQQPPPTPLERGTISLAVEHALRPLDRLLNRVYSSRYNPLYQSGPIAVTLLLFVLVTGLYLIFFYKISAPYESMVAIQDQAWLGRWIRAFHRYASDAAMVVVVVHFLRMIAQGKTWGPRFLAWVTGVLLLLFFFVSGWTGYVMVWDDFGQSLASTGARMLDLLPVFVEPVSRSFSGGVAKLPQSFFFMNLFLHVAIPLGMIIGVWVHTARMARATWFLDRRTFLASAGVLILVSALWPAPLGLAGDLLAMPGTFAADVFFAGWLPLAWASPVGAFFAWVFGFALLMSVPLIVRPRKDRKPGPSFNDPKACQGCGQCVKDCPYEAISMIPRPEGKGSPTVALVDPDTCVSCGICAGSCVSFTIGPAGRKAPDQLAALQKWLPQGAARNVAPDAPATSDKVLVLACQAQPAINARLKNLLAAEKGFEYRESDCQGSLHPAVIDRMARGYRAIGLVCCPPENSINRESFEALTERLGGQREPTLGKRASNSPILVLPTGDGEEPAAFRNLLALRDGRAARPGEHARGPLSRGLAVAATLLIVVGIAAASRVPLQASSTDHGILRLSWRLPGQAIRKCVDYTPEELAALPIHMRTPQKCTTDLLSYRLTVRLGNGADLREVDQVYRPTGLQGDRPLYVEREFPLTPGTYPIEIAFMPERDDAGVSHLSYKGDIQVEGGRITLVTLRGTRDLEIVR